MATSNFLKRIRKKTGSTSFKDSKYAEPTHYINTGDYALNRIISGDVHKGIPAGRVIILAGETGTLKTVQVIKLAVNAINENNYDVVLTGHTINDGLRVLLHSLFHWNIEYLPKLSPVSKKDRTFVKKAKPLFFVWEKDIIKEVEKNEIPYISKKCPLSKKAKTKEMDEIINKVIEIKGKPFLETFLKGFLKKRKIFKNEFTLNECIVCGSLTSSEKCSFCKLFNLNKSIDLKH